MNTQVIKKTKLEKFIVTKKFAAEKLYSGAVNEMSRIKFEAYVNDLGTRLLNRVDSPLTKEDVFAEFKPTMVLFEQVDTEDRERFLRYIEELLDILEIKVSDGYLNKWLYGFDPQQSADTRNAEAVAAMSSSERQLLSKLDPITKETAQDVLVKILGPASNKAGAIQIWFLDKDSNSAISINSQNGSTVLLWISKDRFMYTRKL